MIGSHKQHYHPPWPVDRIAEYFNAGTDHPVPATSVFRDKLFVIAVYSGAIQASIFACSYGACTLDDTALA